MSEMKTDRQALEDRYQKLRADMQDSKLLTESKFQMAEIDRLMLHQPKVDRYLVDNFTKVLKQSKNLELHDIKVFETPCFGFSRGHLDEWPEPKVLVDITSK
jgi:hypothetical protein